MLKNYFFLLFIFTYLFNLSSFFVYLQYFNAFNINNKYLAKIMSMFYFFCIVGLPLMSLFFLKIRLLVNIFNNNVFFGVLFFFVVVISLFVYFSMVNRFLNNKPMHKNISYDNKNILDESLGKFIIFYIYSNILYNLFFFFIFFICDNAAVLQKKK